jgi:hypothetical protein
VRRRALLGNDSVSKQRIGKQTIIKILLETVFPVLSVISNYKEEFS